MPPVPELACHNKTARRTRSPPGKGSPGILGLYLPAPTLNRFTPGAGTGKEGNGPLIAPRIGDAGFILSPFKSTSAAANATVADPTDSEAIVHLENQSFTAHGALGHPSWISEETTSGPMTQMVDVWTARLSNAEKLNLP